MMVWVHLLDGTYTQATEGEQWHRDHHTGNLGQRLGHKHTHTYTCSLCTHSVHMYMYMYIHVHVYMRHVTSSNTSMYLFPQAAEQIEHLPRARGALRSTYPCMSGTSAHMLWVMSYMHIDVLTGSENCVPTRLWICCARLLWSYERERELNLTSKERHM